MKIENRQLGNTRVHKLMGGGGRGVEGSFNWCP